MKHLKGLTRVGQGPSKANELDGKFRFSFDVINLLSGIQGLLVTKGKINNPSS